MLAFRRLIHVPRIRINLWFLCAALVTFQAISLSHNHAIADNTHSQTCDICLHTQNTGAPASEPPHLALQYVQAPAPAVQTVATPTLFYYSSHSPRAPPV